MQGQGQGVTCGRCRCRRTLKRWTKAGNLERAKGLTREEIFATFSGRLEPIAVLNKRNRQLLDVKSKDVFCSEAYFIDHVVNHHPEISPKEYLALQKNLDAADEIVADANNATIGFIKAVGDRKRILFVRKDEGSIIFYRTMYFRKGRLSLRYKKISLAQRHKAFTDRERAPLDTI